MNCIRRNSQPVDVATERASIVLPTPGTSSIKTCPPLIRATSASSIVSFFPTITVPMFLIRDLMSFFGLTEIVTGIYLVLLVIAAEGRFKVLVVFGRYR